MKQNMCRALIGILLGILLITQEAYGLENFSSGELTKRTNVENFVKQAAQYLEKNGPKKAFPIFNDRHGPFRQGDLYIIVHDLNGRCVAHGDDPKLIGINRWNEHDAEGRYYVRETIQTGKKGGGWLPAFSHREPATGKLKEKYAYVQKAGAFIVGAGYYK